MRFVSLEELKRDLFEDIEGRAAYLEAKYRRRIAARLEAAMKASGTSYRDLASAMRSSKSQVQRLLNKQRGGSLTLLTIVKAAEVLGLRVEDLLAEEDGGAARAGRSRLRLVHNSVWRADSGGRRDSMRIESEMLADGTEGDRYYALSA